MLKNKIRDAFLGLAIGDALGVPVEFKSRAYLENNPVKDMLAFGTHHQEDGTWSDDSSLAFCTAEALCQGYDLNQIAKNFVLWYEEAFWSARGKVFDIGIATSEAMHRLSEGVSPLLSGNTEESSNGNGSLMRILPLAFYLKDKDLTQRFQIISEVSAITHAHVRSIVACIIYIELAIELIQGLGKMQAYKKMQEGVNVFLSEYSLCSDEEIFKFHRILENPYSDYKIKPLVECVENEISSSGYVLHTLEASIWCFLKFDNYKDIVLQAVNLGSDTDTTACVAGGLAGLYYGMEAIPQEWIDTLARKEDIINLAMRFGDNLVDL